MANALTPTLNWKEIFILGKQIEEPIRGLYLERIFIPARTRFSNGFLLGEMALGFSGKKALSVVFSLRPSHPYIYLTQQKLRVATQASRTGFDLALSKYLKGMKIDSVDVALRERVIIFWFVSGKNYLGLALSLIPAKPEAYLVETVSRVKTIPWKVILSSRALKKNEKAPEQYEPPSGENAPESLSARTDFFLKPDSLSRIIEDFLSQEAFHARKESCERLIKKDLKLTTTRLRQSHTAMKEASEEADWQRFGDLLKGTLGQLEERPVIYDGMREVLDFETGATLKIPSDPKLNAVAQVEKFFTMAKRKAKRISEAKGRIADFESRFRELEVYLNRINNLKDWSGLEEIEQKLGLTSLSTGSVKRRQNAWPGKSFVSKDGLPIWVGRSKDENLELTFKSARGNDLWLHLRGRPGAHVIVQLPQNKSAPLETLLDAAALVIHYSGGRDWGKTEVDYTYKKYVKRIKDSTEVSYTNNKTLNVEIDQLRLKRLLSVTDEQK